MLGNSPLGPQIAEARRQDDFARATAYRLTRGSGAMQTTGVPAAAATTAKSIRYRIGAMAISAGQRIAGVEIRPRSLDDSAQGAIHGVR